MQHGLHCIQQLTAADWLKQPEHRALLHVFLRAFGKDATSSQDSHQSPSVTACAMKSHEAGLSAHDGHASLMKSKQKHSAVNELLCMQTKVVAIGVK